MKILAEKSPSGLKDNLNPFSRHPHGAGKFLEGSLVPQPGEIPLRSPKIDPLPAKATGPINLVFCTTMKTNLKRISSRPDSYI